MKWYGLQLGFRKGVNIVSDMGGNLLQKLTEGASILGLFVMGVLVTKWTTINVPLVVSQTPGANGSTVTMTVQNILDQLCPGLLALGLTLLMVYFNKLTPKMAQYGEAATEFIPGSVDSLRDPGT